MAARSVWATSVRSTVLDTLRLYPAIPHTGGGPRSSIRTRAATRRGRLVTTIPRLSAVPPWAFSPERAFQKPNRAADTPHVEQPAHELPIPAVDEPVLELVPVPEPDPVGLDEVDLDDED